MVDDAAGTRAPLLFAGHVGDSQERFDGMHVGVEPTVRVEFGEFGVSRIDGQPDFIVPELVEEDLLGMIEQFGCARAAEQGCGG